MATTKSVLAEPLGELGDGRGIAKCSATTESVLAESLGELGDGRPSGIAKCSATTESEPTVSPYKVGPSWADTAEAEPAATAVAKSVATANEWVDEMYAQIM